MNDESGIPLDPAPEVDGASVVVLAPPPLPPPPPSPEMEVALCAAAIRLMEISRNLPPPPGPFRLGECFSAAMEKKSEQRKGKVSQNLNTS